MTIPRTSRRTFLSLAAGSALGAFGLSACGTSGPAQPGGAASAPATGGGATGTATMWALTGEPNEKIRGDSVDAFNKLGKGTFEARSSRTTLIRPRSVLRLERERHQR
jgi:ABC-type glycerol-3-phosphate transport system substrate-binding protein